MARPEGRRMGTSAGDLDSGHRPVPVVHGRVEVAAAGDPLVHADQARPRDRARSGCCSTGLGCRRPARCCARSPRRRPWSTEWQCMRTFTESRPGEAVVRIHEHGEERVRRSKGCLASEPCTSGSLPAGSVPPGPVSTLRMPRRPGRADSSTAVVCVLRDRGDAVIGDRSHAPHVRSLRVNDEQWG